MAKCYIIGMKKEVECEIIEKDNRGTEVKILESEIKGKHFYISNSNKHEYVKELIEETIRRIFNSNFTTKEDHDYSDESCVIAEEIITELELDHASVNIHKLDRYDRESITGYDYRTKRITTEEMINYHEVEALCCILIKIIDRLAEGKSIKQQIKKWLV